MISTVPINDINIIFEEIFSTYKMYDWVLLTVI